MNEIELLEKKLLDPEARKSVRFLSDVLADEFIEIASDGKRWTKSEILAYLQNEVPIVRQLKDFKIQLLSPDIVLATYRAVKIIPEQLPMYSFRSSYWRRENHRWQMVFHQGTQIKNEVNEVER